ncbi:MAG: hypothetical protein EBR82_46010 [Caulobacteraceae bacterium]|nr:hypothetical protein [Caulobacteraceae bacterium]
MRYRSLVRATEPANEPVTLAEAKAHLRIDSTSEDTLITALIKTARVWAEEYLDRTLCFTQWTLRTDSFYGPVGSPAQFGLRADGNNIEGRQGTVPNLDVELPRPPMVQSGTATAVTIAYTPSVSGTTATLDSTQYRVDRTQTPGAVRPLYGGTWPGHLVDQNSVAITWWAGYSSDGTSVPATIKAALLMLIAHLWRNREASAEAALTEVPFGVRSLLDTMRWGSYR